METPVVLDPAKKGLAAITKRKGRQYISIIDPQTGERSNARLEPSLQTDDCINLSFEPYLYYRPETLPESSRQALFARRPAYAFLKTDLGLGGYQCEDLAVLSQQDLEARVQDLGIPDIIMAPWAYPDPDIDRVMLNVHWYDKSKAFTGIAWNGAVRDGQKRIDSFWTAVGQLKPTLPRQVVFTQAMRHPFNLAPIEIWNQIAHWLPPLDR